MKLKIIKEDKEWWLKRRPRDKKNLRILLGKSARGARHVKKGGPFTKDPPRYKGNKGEPGLGLLEEVSVDLLKTAAEKMAKENLPNADAGFISKIGDYFKDNPLIKTIGDLKDAFSGFLGKLGGEEDKATPEVSADASADLNLDTTQLRNKFKGYKGETTSFRGYVHFLWDQFDKNKDNTIVQGWTKQKTEDLVRKLAPKYELDPLIVLGVMSGESGGRPVGVFGQTRNSKGSPETAIKANSTAYGSGQITLPTYEYVKNKIGVPHYMLWNPIYGIEATIAVIKLKIQKRGSLEAAMAAYAGSAAGGRRKMAAINKARGLTQ